MNDRILDIIADNIHERMQDALDHDPYLRDTEEKINNYEKEYDAIKPELSEKHQKTIRHLLDSYTENNSAYARATYRQGFKDCYSLLCEI